MRIIGVDVGHTCGIFAIDCKGEDIKKIYFCDVTTNDIGEYFVYSLAQNIESALFKLRPDLVVFEGYAFGGGRFFNFIQPEIQVQVKRFLVEKNIPFYQAHISAMRKAVLGKGDAKKKDAKYFMLEKFPQIGKVSDHIYDAGIPAYLGYLFKSGKLEEKMNQVVLESIVGDIKCK